MPDIFDELTPDNAPGGDIFDEIAPEAGISKPRSLVNSLVRGIKTAQALPDVAIAVGTADIGKPTIRQERKAYVAAMSDPWYQERLMQAGDDPVKLRRVESTLGPAARLDVAMTPARTFQKLTAQDLAAQQAEIAAIPQSPAQQKLAAAKTPGEKWRVWLHDPVELTAGIVLESLPPSVVGATAGTIVGGPGVGTAAGAGMSSAAMTFSSEFLGAASQQGVDITNPEQLENFLNDQNAFNRAFQTAVTKSALVGGVDATTAGLAGRWIAPALKQGLQQRIIATGKELAMQMAGGAGGEAAGQMASGQQFDPFDVAMEALAEVATAPGEAVGNIMAKRAATTPTSAPAAQTVKPDIFDQVASGPQPLRTASSSHSRPPVAVAAPAPAGTSPGEALTQEIAGNVVPPSAQRVDDATGKPIEDNSLQGIYQATKKKFEAVKAAVQKLFPGVQVKQAPDNVDIRMSADGTTLEVSHTLLDDIQKMYPGKENEVLTLAVEEEKIHHGHIKQLGSAFKEKLAQVWQSAPKEIRNLVRSIYGDANIKADEWGAELLRMATQAVQHGRTTEHLHPRRGSAAKSGVAALQAWAKQQTGEVGAVINGGQESQSTPDETPATKADLKALADFIEKGGPNPFAAKVEPKPANAETDDGDLGPVKPAQQIQNPEVTQTVTPPETAKPDVFDQVAPPATTEAKPKKAKRKKMGDIFNQPPTQKQPLTDADLEPDVRKDLRAEGVTPENIEALLSGSKTAAQVVDEQLGITRNSGSVDAKTMSIEENPDGSRTAMFTPEAGPASNSGFNIGQMSHEEAIRIAQEQGIERIGNIIRNAKSPATEPEMTKYGVSKAQWDEMANYNDYDQQARFGTTRAKLMEKATLGGIPPATEAKPKKAKKNLFNNPPPGGWTDADKVPEQFRKPKTANEQNIQANTAQSAPGNGQEVAQTQVSPQTPEALPFRRRTSEGYLVGLTKGGKETKTELYPTPDEADKAMQSLRTTGEHPTIGASETVSKPAQDENAISEGDWVEYEDSYGKTHRGKVDAIYSTAAMIPTRGGVQAVKRTEYSIVDASGKAMISPKYGTTPRKVKQPTPPPLAELQNQVTGAIERGEKEPIIAKEAPKTTQATNDKIAAIRAKREEIKARLRAKLGQVNLGVDPEVATIAAELAVNYTQEGVVRFTDFAKAVKAELPDIWDALKQYLRGAWTTAADMNDGIEEVTRDEARAILDGIDKGEPQEESSVSNETEPGLSEKPTSGTGAVDQPGNESTGSAPPSDRQDVAGSLPETDRPAKSGGRPRTGGKRAGSQSPSGGASDAGGILGSPAASGTGTDPVQPGNRGAISQPDHSPGRDNYWLKNPEAIVGGGPKARFAKNQRAIETVQRLIADGKDPNPEEQDALAAYTGWGAFGQELFNGSWEYHDPKKGWEAEDAWLRDHLGEADWKSAQNSIINAHYTDPVTVQTIWKAIVRMGFKGGRTLEPSVGIGNFFSLMPRDVMANSTLTGIELDQLTGRIAQMLHPKASISIKGYQDSQTADNFYDLVLGNWPFSDTKPADRRYNHFSPVLHDYFFLKALDQVRPGGLVVGITSTGTMDKATPTVRRYLAARGELVASFRLPAGTFGDYAGTNVVTDLVILRKRPEKIENPTDAWIDTVEVETKQGKFRLNKYYRENPSNIIGTLGFGHGTTKGRAGMMVTPPPNHQQAIEAIAERVPENIFQPWTRPESKVKHIQGVPANARQFAIIEKDGDLYQVQGEQLALLHDLRKWKLKADKATAKRMAEAVRAIAIRDSYDAMMDAYRKGEDFETARKQLAKRYREFVKEHGSVRQSTMIEVMERAGDPGMTSVLNLEDEQGKARDILERNILRKRVPTGAGSIEDAYSIQRNRSVNFSVADVAEIAGKSEAEVIARLTELDQIFKAPDGTWQARDQYLADNVRRKLREAEAAAEQGMDMARNIEALKKIQPKDTPYFEIEVRMGANWVAHDDYKNFVNHLIKVDVGDVDVQRQATGWRIKIDDPIALRSPEARTLWGIDHPNTSFSAIINAAMNGTSVVVKVENEDGNLVPDRALTEQANGKVDAIREEFQKWIWQDSERIARLSKEYNEANNSMVAPDRDGSHLMLEGLALTLGRGEFDFRKHQKDAVWRGVQDGKAMFGHEVGTGKTFTMAGLAMEGRRLGVFRKPLIFAHNANHSTVIADFRRAYPAGKFLHLDSLSPEERAAKLRQIVLDDWDAVVVPHSLIERFTLREESLNELAAREIQALEDELMSELADAGQEVPDRAILDDPKEFNKWAAYKEGLTTAKQLVKARARIKERIKKKAQEASKEGAVFFEDLGVDAIFVDEAHIFKKIALATRKEIKGLNKSESGVGFSLSLLTDYVKSRNSGKGVFLFTGTPITNTLNEAYNMMRYVMSADMQEAGIERFDDWFNVFADSATEVEMNDAGIYEAIERLRAFINVPELARMAGRFFDIVLAKDMPEFKPRESDEGMTENPVGRPRKKIVPAILEMSPQQKEHLESIRERYRRWMNADGKTRREMMMAGKDTPLQISGEASLSALDYRLVDRFAPDFEGSKANAAVNNIAGIYHEHPKATQMVFMEQGFNDYTDRMKTRRDDKGNPSTDADGKPIKDKERVIKFNVLRDMVEKLNAKGIPPEEIAIFANMNLDPIAQRPDDILRRCVRVTGAVTKEDISALMRAGKIRVAFGQTETMGTGVNAQDYMRAMHHLDAPWMPGSLEQRNGRGWRQGNKWNTVLEYRYTVEGSGDGKRWQVLLNKVRFISRFIELLNGDGNIERSLEGDAADAADENDAVASFENTFSAAAGDPRQMLKVGLEKKLRQLEIKQSNHISATWKATNKIAELQRSIETGGKMVADVRQDLDSYRNQIAGKPFKFTVEDSTYDDRDTADAAIKVVPIQPTAKQVASIGAFKIYFQGGFSQYMVGPSGFRYDMGTRSVGSAEALLRGLGSRLEKMESEIPKMRDSIESLKEMASTPFSAQAKLDATKRALDQITAEIQASPFPVPSWIRTTVPQGSLIYLQQGSGLASHEVAAHRWDENGWWVLYQDATNQLRPVSYENVLDETGKPIFEPRPFIKPPSATAAPGAAPVNAGPAEPAETELEYDGGTMPASSSTFADWLDKWIAATDIDSTQLMEGVTRAPVWFTKSAVNGVLRVIRGGYRAGLTLADAIEEGVTWLKNQKVTGFKADEARDWLKANITESQFEESASDWRVIQQQMREAERELKAAIAQYVQPPSGMRKAEARRVRDMATARLRNLRHDLMRNPAYAEHMILRERQVWQQLKALLEPTGIKPSPDGLLGREDRIREVLSDVEVRRVVELDREWEQVRQEIEAMPKKMVASISNKLYPPKGQTKTDLELPSEWLQAQLGDRSPVTEPTDITTTADRLRDTVAALPDSLREAWKGSRKGVRAAWAKAQTMANRETVSATKDAADNKAQILSRQAANVVLHEMNRAFGVPIDTRNAAREAALTFAIEAGDKGTLDLLRETVLGSDQARSKWGRAAVQAIAYAEKHWDRFEPVVTLYNRVTNAQAAAEQASGIKTLMRASGYVFHLQDVLENWAHLDMTGGTGGAASPFKNIRDYATYADSIAAGLNPRTLNAVDLLQRRISLGQKLINYRGWQESLKRIIDPATEQPLGADVIIRVRADGSETETAPVGYKLVRFAGQPYAIHRAYSGLFNALTADSGWRQGAGWHTLMKAATTAKHTMLMFDTFHLGRLAFWSAVTRGAGDGVKTLLPGNPASYKQGLTLLDSTIADLRKMADNGELTAEQAKNLVESKATLMKLLNAGLNVGSVGDNIYSDWVQKLPLVGQFNRWLFEKYQRGAMTEVALIEYQRQRQANPELSDEQVARKVAKAVNIRFGNLNSQAWIKSRHAQDLARLVFLAPQWNESLIRAEFEAVKDAGALLKNLPQGRLKVGTLGRAVATAFIGQFIANQLINWFFRDKPTWENEEEGFEAKLSAYVPDYLGNSKGYFLNPMTLPAEISHLILKGHARTGRWDQALIDAIKSRFSSFGRFGDVFIEGKNSVGERATGLGNRLALAAEDSAPLPIGANAPVRLIASKVAGESKEQYPGQFQRQMMQTFGIKPDSVPSPEQRMRRLAREFNTAQGKPDLGDFGKSAYADLDNALRVGNLTKARQELATLLQNHDAEAIQRRYEQRVTGRFTGSAEREPKFVRTLTPEQRKQYDAALAERRRLKLAVEKLLTESSAKARSPQR